MRFEKRSQKPQNYDSMHFSKRWIQQWQSYVYHTQPVSIFCLLLCMHTLYQLQWYHPQQMCKLANFSPHTSIEGNLASHKCCTLSSLKSLNWKYQMPNILSLITFILEINSNNKYRVTLRKMIIVSWSRKTWIITKSELMTNDRCTRLSTANLAVWNILSLTLLQFLLILFFY